mgnify:CR=1 FL=1
MEENTFPKRNIPRDLFLHLLAIVTLYWSAISFVTLLWQYINRAFPDVLTYMYDYSNGIIRFSVSALMIVFPVFILVSWYLNKIYRREAVVRESKIRKWLIYLTLFIASLVIIGDLIAVVNTFLGGEVTVRFILKALSVLLVAGVVFGYYLDDVRKETPTKLAKPFAWVSGVLVLIVIITAFFMVGSPSTARLVNFDQRKIEDLNAIQSEIVNYWQAKEKLPSTFSDLNNAISGFQVPVDPQSKDKGYSYEYNIKDATVLKFELCATFNKPVQQNSPKNIYPIGAGINQNWDHGTGRVCFERTIDKQLYPPFVKAKQ